MEDSDRGRRGPDSASDITITRKVKVALGREVAVVDVEPVIAVRHRGESVLGFESETRTRMVGGFQPSPNSGDGRTRPSSMCRGGTSNRS